ncbi:putative iron permease ftr1 family protein [Rosellinia necatrix]|uniref:Putative iron permease ftr1 family protein n=1 Tax=Rosellinia necatrix TaxID=77044 RepID=A0A1W2TK28_ROSNE|nr:putative iron permease ftr1 family protein [Rosellinia necatrix]
MAKDVFSVPVFLVVFRETLETAIIVSVLLAFLKQTLDGPNRNVAVYKALVKQVWLGVGIGFFICLVIAAGIIGTFYTVGRDAWQTNEYNYEGAFALFASLIISFVGVALLRVGKLQEKWRAKLAKALETPVVGGGAAASGGFGARFKRLAERYAMFVLPFVTVLREGIEAIVFIAGVSFSAPATAVPLPVVIGLIVGSLVGYVLYRGGTTTKLQYFLVASTCLLYLVGAGLFSRAVWYFEAQQWNNIVGGDAVEVGTGAGSYDIDNSVWHVNCCSPVLNGGGGWGIFNAILGWTNSATYGSVISYNLYWIAIVTALGVMRYREVKGHWPLLKAKADSVAAESDVSVASGEADSRTKTEASASITAT